ncbi:hypothetical protein CEXT_512161 [Caerostris extrusa]|uniref:Uncharacterized protein n=1 Tax=Caerostris extrusa TaxID=172846 RepID=A0AAV4M7W6_CAEEX|nr:hypothetical protein CEXT_512161 [Caerostris extrusa]
MCESYRSGGCGIIEAGSYLKYWLVTQSKNGPIDNSDLIKLRKAIKKVIQNSMFPLILEQKYSSIIFLNQQWHLATLARVLRTPSFLEGGSPGIQTGVGEEKHWRGRRA